MIEELLFPNFKNENVDQFLIRIGVELTKSPDEYQMASIRIGPNFTIYGFKLEKDYSALTKWLKENKITFEIMLPHSIGARYPYHISIEK